MVGSATIGLSVRQLSPELSCSIISKRGFRLSIGYNDPVIFPVVYCMSESAKLSPPKASEFSSLQEDILQVVQICENLKVENHNLRKQVSVLVKEGRKTAKASEAARERLQVIIGRLRELENNRPSS